MQKILIGFAAFAVMAAANAGNAEIYIDADRPVPVVVSRPYYPDYTERHYYDWDYWHPAAVVADEEPIMVQEPVVYHEIPSVRRARR